MKTVAASMLFLAFLLTSALSHAQLIPSEDNNIPYLVTFGKNGNTSWGDDDFSQTFFFVTPRKEVRPVYIRIFDPEASGMDDEKKGEFNTKTRFSIYGGKTCYSNYPKRNNTTKDPKENFKGGNLLATKTFENTTKYQGAWYTFGPFNPTEGELANDLGGYVFKIIAEGESGDDGNLYRYFFSSSPNENKAIEGGNAFTYEYTFRLSDNQADVSHLYPFIPEDVTSVNISNFDFDDDGYINIVSVLKKEEKKEISLDNVWTECAHKVVAKEKKTSLDIQFIKSKTQQVKNNNVTLYVTNQRGESMAIYTVAIGGIPNPQNMIDFKAKNKIIIQDINKK